MVAPRMMMPQPGVQAVDGRHQQAEHDQPADTDLLGRSPAGISGTSMRIMKVSASPYPGRPPAVAMPDGGRVVTSTGRARPGPGLGPVEAVRAGRHGRRCSCVSTLQPTATSRLPAEERGSSSSTVGRDAAPGERQQCFQPVWPCGGGETTRWSAGPGPGRRAAAGAPVQFAGLGQRQCLEERLALVDGFWAEPRSVRPVDETSPTAGGCSGRGPASEAARMTPCSSVELRLRRLARRHRQPPAGTPPVAAGVPSNRRSVHLPPPGVLGQWIMRILSPGWYSRTLAVPTVSSCARARARPSSLYPLGWRRWRQRHNRRHHQQGGAGGVSRLRV